MIKINFFVEAQNSDFPVLLCDVVVETELEEEVNLVLEKHPTTCKEHICYTIKTWRGLVALILEISSQQCSCEFHR